jgi:DNA-binding MarR family transcriptional regulator
MPTDDDPIEWSRKRWSAQKQPGVAHFTAMSALFRANQVVIANVERMLKDLDLTRTSYLLLVTLRLSHDKTRPLGVLSKNLMVHPTTITLAVDQLERRGLVKRGAHPTDRRTILATLSPDGIALVEKANALLAEGKFGLTDVPIAMANRLTDTLGDVRTRLDDVDKDERDWT